MSSSKQHGLVETYKARAYQLQNDHVSGIYLVQQLLNVKAQFSISLMNAFGRARSTPAFAER
jgi:hypothetical protein